MAPPLSSDINFSIEALSGICGSVSIACWIVVFSPQIIKNFRRQSAEGLSVAFIVIWLVGDVFNILGAIMQKVLPTMIILAVYYTLADVVLLGQVWWYKGFTFKDEPVSSVNGSNGSAHYKVGDDDDGSDDNINNEGRPLLNGSHRDRHNLNGTFDDDRLHVSHSSGGRRRSSAVDGTRLSPATPFIDDQGSESSSTPHKDRTRSRIQTFLFNSIAIILVCAAGVVGWWLSDTSSRHKDHKKHDHEDFRGDLPQFDVWGQIFGYLCAVLYLGSRVPQLLLNYRRKSTEGVSLLFFLFACIGNLTYDLSIFAFNPAPYCYNGPENCLPGEKGMIYGRYIAVNASWIVGSFGTLLLDMVIFVQFFLYLNDDQPSTVVRHE